MNVIILVLLIAVVQAVQGFVILILFRQVGLLGLRIRPAGARPTLSGPTIGEIVPHLSLQDLGDPDRLLELPGKDDRSWLVIFMAPKCSSCQNLAPAVRSLSQETADEIGWAVICMGRRTECLQLREQRSFGSSMFCYASDDIRDLYEVGTTPYALLIDQQGTLISKGLVNHIEHLENMISSARHGHPERSLPV